MPQVPPVDRARRLLAGEVTRLVMGDHQPNGERRDELDPGAGLFGPDSVTWKLHSDFCLLAGGLRALMLQTMHPLAMAGVADHSEYRSDPLGRLANTSAYVGTTVFGTRDEAVAAVAAVKRVHRRVAGVAPDGRRYDANDPHLLTWVHHTLVDSFLRAFRRYGGARLSDREADRYVAEMAVMMDLFDGEPAARSVAGLRRYFLDIRPELRATREARETMRFLLVPPLPLHTRGAYAMLAAAAVGMLPTSVRRQLWVPTLPMADPLVVRPVCRVLFRTLDWVMTVPPEPADAAAS